MTRLAIVPASLYAGKKTVRPAGGGAPLACMRSGALTIARARGRLNRVGTVLGGKAEIDDIAVLHDVFLALEPHFAVIAADRHRPAADQRVVGDDLGADEAALNVTVDLAGRQLRRRATRD